MNITEAQAAQTVLRALTNYTGGSDLPPDPPTIEQLTEAAETLAARSSAALKTGITAEQVQPLLASRRGYPTRLRLAVHR